MTFEWPWLLMALGLVPALLALYLVAQRRRRVYAVRFTNLALLREVVGRGPGMRRHIPPLLFLVGLATLLLSLARPHAVIAVPRDQTAVMLVLDVSGSMSVDDLSPSRLDAAKRAAEAFLDASPQDAQLGLVTFSSTASVRAPLTRDPDPVRRAIAGLSADGGTAIGDGLALALDQLAQRPADESGGQAPALVVLLSDGQQTNGQIAPEEAAARARQQEVTVHAVGIGLRGAAPRVAGLRQPARLDEATLRGVAETTGGQYFYAAESSQLERIYADLGSRVNWVEERMEVSALVSGLGGLFLVAAGLLSLRWFQQLP